MSQPNFTPGPWRYESEIAGTRWLVGVDDSTIFHIGDDSEWPEGDTARLIAAAPALYEALKAQVYGGHGCLNQMETPCRLCQSGLDVLALIDAPESESANA